MSERRISDHLAYLVAHAHRKLHGALEREFHAEGLSVEQWRMLEILSDGVGRSMGEMAELVLMNHPTLTKMTDRMVARGLVHRTPDPEDQRRVLVYMTDLGLDLVERLRGRTYDQDTALEEHLGPRRSAELKKLLSRIIELKS